MPHRPRSRPRPAPDARRLAGVGACALLLALAAGCRSPGPFTPVPDPVSVRVGTIEAEELVASLDPLPTDLEARVRRLEELFQDAGCGESLRIEGEEDDLPDVICELRGDTPYTLVVTANLDPERDRVGRGENWTAIALLPHLYRAVSAEWRDHTYLFIGLGTTRYREFPAKRYLDDLPDEERTRVRGLIRLEALGIGSTAIWTERADRNLRQDLFAVAKALELPLRETIFSRDETAAFPSAGITSVPDITLHSLDRESSRLVTRPLASQIDAEAYVETARMIAVYLAYLDDTLRIRAERAWEP